MAHFIDEVIERHADERPESVFIEYRDQKISYGQMGQAVNRVANAMRGLGLGKESKSAIFMPNSPEWLYAFYGATKAGALNVLINWQLTREEVAYCLKKSASEIVFTTQPYTETVKRSLPDCPDLKYVVEMSSESSDGVMPFSEFINRAPSALPGRVSKSLDDPILMYFTSGTTGRPKGAVHTHKSISSIAEAWVNYAGLTDKDCSYNITPLYHNTGLVHGSHCVAVVGGREYLVEKFSVSRFWDDVRKHGCTYFIALETILRLLMNQPENPGDAHNSIRIVMAAVSPDLWDVFEKRFNCIIVQGYGSSESPLLSGTPLDSELRRKKIKNARGNYVGKSVDPAMKQAVLDENGNEVAPGVMGEIARKGAGTMKGYYEEPELTAKAFKGGWLHMGDSGYMDEDGHLYFVDRLKDIVRRGGENISSREVESVLLQHPSVAVTSVIPVPDPIRMEEVKAYIIPEKGKDVTAEEIWEFCNQRLAGFKIPRYIEFRDELPMTATNRVKKSVLKKEKDDLISGCFDITKNR